MKSALLKQPVKPSGEDFVKCIRRERTPGRVHCIELIVDTEVRAAITERFGLAGGLNPNDPYYDYRVNLAEQRFLGYDYVMACPENIGITFETQAATIQDTADLARAQGRKFVSGDTGPIKSWDDFERYPWPEYDQATTRHFEWLEINLPDDMIVIGGMTAHALEWLTWLMGYETLCTAVYLQPDLVQAVYEKVREICDFITRTMLQFDRVQIIWGSDDMGFRTGPLLPPDSLRRYVFPVHKHCAKLAHDAGRPYLLHSCGNLSIVMDDLIGDVGIDAKHSFEDTIEDVRDAKDKYGNRIAVLGGIDVDFLCTASEKDIRSRVRGTLERCMPQGGYCLGTGNSVANYIPLDNYLVMLDEGRKFCLN
ncbi:MAG: uroporphyrinogen-III decarboxylase-like protein [Chitinivibrionales bacterium]|nr:uroporphyrinogen-III decarboxylase-like protein [Chitinivibrionales bacterium]MBD3395032.1 uroporphyrinogen-III decarboxylase-like protein [Chitinivibrionales bacterium]